MAKSNLHVLTRDHETGRTFVIEYDVADDTMLYREVDIDGREHDVEAQTVPDAVERQAKSLVQLLLGG